MAQQKTFEFFKWDEVPHPLENWRNGSQERQGYYDSHGRYWYCSLNRAQSNLTYSNFYDDTTTIKVSIAFKAEYSYSVKNVFVDELDQIITHIVGTKIVNSQVKYDNHFVKRTTTGQVSYLPSSSYAPSDSTVSITSFSSINNKLLALLSNQTVIWDSKAPVSVTSNRSIVSDYTNTVYLLQDGQQGLYAFYADGTSQKLLPNETFQGYWINNKTLDGKKIGKFGVLTNVGAYVFENKIQTKLNVSIYQQLIKSYLVNLYMYSRGGYDANVLTSQKGFNVTSNGQSTPFLFSSQLQDADSLNFVSANLQKDSSLLLFYWSEQSSYVNELYTFVWKNGVSKLLRKDDVHSYNIYTKSTATGYVGKDHLYIYLNDYGSSSVLQLKDGVGTKIPFKSSDCSTYIMRIASDESYLWISNESIENSPCSIARMAHDSYFINGRVFYDVNANGLKDGSEFWYGKLTLKVKPSGLLLFPDKEGNYAFKGEAGAQYSVGLLDSSLYSSIKMEVSTGYIGVKLKNEKPEVSTAFWLPSSRCATNRPASFSLHNTGVVPVQKVVVRLIPQGLQLLQNNVLVDTAVFEHSNVAVGQYTNVSYNIQWPTPDVVGQTATLKTITELYVGNVLASSVLDSVQTVIRCSYDPNDKSVTPVGLGEEAFALKKNALKYLIRFENTGNDTAYNIVVKDTLSNQLDWSSFRFIGASHLVNSALSPQGVLSFHFNNIMLPDTGKGKEAAQGYVTFAISPRSDVSDYAKLCNRAAIYFDGNKPVITNDACNTLVEKMPTVTKTDEQLLGNSDLLYPNPAQDWVKLADNVQTATLYNALGGEVLRSNGGRMSLVGVPNGVYLVRIAHQNGSVTTEKLSVVR